MATLKSSAARRVAMGRTVLGDRCAKKKKAPIHNAQLNSGSHMADTHVWQRRGATHEPYWHNIQTGEIIWSPPQGMATSVTRCD
jgi:hypothetical protein